LEIPLAGTRTCQRQPAACRGLRGRAWRDVHGATVGAFGGRATHYMTGPFRRLRASLVRVRLAGNRAPVNPGRRKGIAPLRLPAELNITRESRSCEWPGPIMYGARAGANDGGPMSVAIVSVTVLGALYVGVRIALRFYFPPDT
jgi:hypothetical protein